MDKKQLLSTQPARFGQNKDTGVCLLLENDSKNTLITLTDQPGHQFLAAALSHLQKMLNDNIQPIKEYRMRLADWQQYGRSN